MKSHLPRYSPIPLSDLHSSQTKTKGNFRGGFTIMELLIASALAAILMIGILFAITQLAKQTQRLRTVSSPTQFNNMIELLRQDLMQAVVCRVMENQIQLQGFMLLDKKTQRPVQQPAEVIYRLVQVGEQHWLIRHQRALGNLTLDDTDANLVCKGILSMDLVALLPPSDEDETPDVAPLKTSQNKSEKPAQSKPFSEELSDQWAPLPPVVQWTLTLPDFEDEIDLDAPIEKTLTYTLVLQ